MKNQIMHRVIGIMVLMVVILVASSERAESHANAEFAGITSRVSLDSTGRQGTGDSTWPSISADGRYTAFRSEASNLVSGDTNSLGDIFVYDRQTGGTSRVSVASDGTQGNGDSYWPSSSDDGRYVAFVSGASNLVSDDMNDVEDIFVHDIQTGETIRASVASDGTQANGRSYVASISGDGQYVAFNSSATNLVPNHTNTGSTMFVHDMQTGETTRVDVATDGTPGNRGAGEPSISSDGRYVAFYAYDTNLVPDDTNTCEFNTEPGLCPDVFVHDRQTGETVRASVSSDGTQGNDASQFGVSLSADGRYVAFESKASNLVSSDTNGTSDVFVHDLQMGETIRVSIASDGTQGNDSSFEPSTSADGRYVAFVSSSNNLVNADTNNQPDIFIHDIQTGETFRISVASDGSQSKGVEGSYAPSISSDGRYVAFYSFAANLVNGDTNAIGDVFVRDLQGCSDKPEDMTLTKPKRYAVVAKAKVPLDWQITNCTATYTVILREGSKTGPKVQMQKNLTVSQFKTKTLTSGKTYFWRVTAINEIGSTKSAWRSFTVQ